jgi:hypothetical protein
MESRDGDRLRDAAHNLKDTAAMFRASSVVGLCRDIERYGQEGCLGQVADLYRALTFEMERARGPLAFLKAQCETIVNEHHVGR